MFFVIKSKSNTDDMDQTDFHGSVPIRVIRAIRVLSHDFSLLIFGQDNRIHGIHDIILSCRSCKSCQIFTNKLNIQASAI